MLLITALVISGVLIHQSYLLMMEKTATQTHSSLTRIGHSYEQLLTTQYSVLKSFKEYVPLYTYMDARFSSNYEAYHAFMQTVQPGLQLITHSMGNMHLRLYSNLPNGKFSRLTSGTLEEWRRTPWFDSELGTQSGVHWVTSPLMMDGPRQQVLTCSIVLRRTADHQPSMLATVFLEEQTMRELIDIQTPEVFLLLDDTGRVITSNVAEYIGLSVTAPGKLSDLSLDSNNSTHFQGQHMFVSHLPFDLANIGIQDWKLVTLVPYDQVTQEIREMVVRSACIALAILAVALLIFMVLSGDISYRIEQLRLTINSFGTEDMPLHAAMHGTDEIAQISWCFDEMQTRITQLIADNTRMHEQLLKRLQVEQELALRQRDAELSALRAQLNPHFLFNTLETIRMNLLIREDRETAHVMQVFAKCIREYMDPSRPMAVLEDELHGIDQYLFILKYRFGEQLNVQIDIDHALYSQKIPRLLLQPVIENAVRYSLERKRGAGRITLKAALEGDQLFLYIQDDGVGISPRELEALRAALFSGQGTSSSAAHLGLRNINRRIRLFYGAQYGVDIQSRLGEGTTVILHLRAYEDRIEGGRTHV